MKKLILLVASGLFTSLFAQNLFFNKGANITVQPGANVYVYGGLVNDAGGTIDHSGNLYLRNGTGTFRGSFTNQGGASATLNNASLVEVAGDWTNDATFTANVGSQVTFNGTDEQTFTRGINANATDEFYNLTIANTAIGNAGGRPVGVYLGTSANNVMKIANTLTFTAGVIATDAANNYVYVLNTATNAITGYDAPAPATGVDDRYIYGNLRRALATTGGSYDFPVGGLRDASGTGADLGSGLQTLNFNFGANVPNVDAIQVRFMPGGLAANPPGECGGAYDNSLDNGSWIVEGYTNAGLADNLTGNYDLTAYNRRYTAVAASAYTNARSNNNGATWLLDGTVCSSSTSGDNALRTGLVDLGYTYTTVYTLTPLPVSDLKLSAFGKNNRIAVTWTTSEELNNKGFELERSLDGQNFQKIAWVNGAGTTTKATQYSFDDYDVEYNKLYYYRVKQIDLDGNYTYSNIATASIKNNIDGFSAYIFPNPASNTLTLSVNSPIDQKLSLKVFDVIGKLVVAENNIQIIQGQQELELNDLIRKLALGTYYVVISPEMQGNEVTIRLIKNQ